MTVFDVIVNTDDIVVLGPPENIDLSISVGEKGDRGATFFAGFGNPNTSQVYDNIFGESVSPIAGDIYINSAVGPQYGWVYIYNPKAVGNKWDEIIKLLPSVFAKNIQTNFTTGEATISIPLSEIFPSGVVQNNPDNYVINVSANSSNPQSISIKNKTISSGNLSISFYCIKYDISTSQWQPLTGSLDFSLNIIVI